MVEVLIDAFFDSIKLLPFLILIHILIEVFEDSFSNKFKKQNIKKSGPFIGSTFGIVPQCAFSVVAVDLFSKRNITIGTLIAIFMATSDEALPIMLANPNQFNKIIIFILVKWLYAMFVGYLFDFIYHRKKEIVIENVSFETEITKFEFDFKDHLIKPTIHALKIVVYIFIIELVFSLIFYFIGEENVKVFLMGQKYLQPLYSLVIGLIPSCASSVIITNLYLESVITFGAAICGLSMNSGIGLMYLFKVNKNKKENMLIITYMIIMSLIIGYVMTLII